MLTLITTTVIIIHHLRRKGWKTLANMKFMNNNLKPNKKYQDT